IITRFITVFGTDAITVQRVGSQVESLSWLISGGFATAVTAFVGQNFGAGKWSRIHKGFTISLVAIVAWGALVTAFLFFAGGFFFHILMPDPQLVSMGSYYLKVLALCQIFGSLEAVASGAFRGMGKTLPPSVSSIGSNVFRVFLTYFLAEKFGLNGIWWGITIGACIRGLVIFIWFQLSFRRLPKVDVLSGEH
ncbi:MAG: MATE family efflux transporter, partial [Clostridiales bacterium]|nr:MATE family efflux transporter [Clostridiales bacterium]